MSKNPVIPYILIFALGIGLIFFMSLYGIDQKKEIADGDGEATEEGTKEEGASSEFDAEAVAQQKCIGCHGGDLKGSVGPNLHGEDKDAKELHEIIKNGKGGMPAGLIPDENIDDMVDYILTLK
ncbi:cytochrome c [Sporosarcina sp. BI001-red]|uniref:cytochrome c550 n=1 Tax=Sporosarcina sp. BI001-red TaxID=2282866 RepID=UPI000E285189|nr:cytochrome c [Sporosarcina sp. BI001-red]REB10001.1 cytochrome c [Sporosarcina sp. BI001-red]